MRILLWFHSGAAIAVNDKEKESKCGPRSTAGGWVGDELGGRADHAVLKLHCKRHAARRLSRAVMRFGEGNCTDGFSFQKPVYLPGSVIPL